MLNTLGIVLILTTILGGVLKVWQKRVSRNFEADTLTVLTQIISVLYIAQAFWFSKFEFEFNIRNSVLVILAGVSWYIGSLITNRSVKETDLTLREPIIQTRTVFVLLLSVIFLGEKVTPIGLVAVLLVFFGAIVSSYKSGVSYLALKKDGVWISLMASFLIAISYSFDKYALNFIDFLSWGFLMYLIPSLFLIPKFKSGLSDIKNQKKKHVIEMLALVFTSSIFYLLLIFIISKADLSWVYPISQLGTVVVFIGGLLLGERTNMRNRTIGAVIGIIGGALLFLNN